MSTALVLATSSSISSSDDSSSGDSNECNPRHRGPATTRQVKTCAFCHTSLHATNSPRTIIDGHPVCAPCLRDLSNTSVAADSDAPPQQRGRVLNPQSSYPHIPNRNIPARFATRDGDIPYDSNLEAGVQREGRRSRHRDTGTAVSTPLYREVFERAKEENRDRAVQERAENRFAPRHATRRAGEMRDGLRRRGRERYRCDPRGEAERKQSASPRRIPPPVGPTEMFEDRLAASTEVSRGYALQRSGSRSRSVDGTEKESATRGFRDLEGRRRQDGFAVARGARALRRGPGRSTRDLLIGLGVGVVVGGILFS